MTAPTQSRDRLPHIRVDQFLSPTSYRSKAVVVPKKDRPARDPQAHGVRLARQYDSVISDARKRFEEHGEQEWSGQPGAYLEVESAEGFLLPKMEWVKKDIRLGATRSTPRGSEIGALYVPLKDEEFLRNKLHKYSSETTDSGKPTFEAFVAPIERFAPITIDSLWRDPRPLPSSADDRFWWECWCWKASAADFEAAAFRQNLAMSDWRLYFPTFTVIPVYSSQREMEQLLDRTNAISELRSATDSARFFATEERSGQRAWVNNLVDRLVTPNEDAPAVCILDRGVAWEHPLLKGFLDEVDCLSHDPRWGNEDHDLHQGHGTKMAGTVLFGDLTYPLADARIMDPNIRLESVKILPPNGFPDNLPETYGPITQSAVARAELNNPTRDRVFCMAITRTDYPGAIPTSWSAAVDQVCSASMIGDEIDEEDGGDEEIHRNRLFFVSAGNIRDHQMSERIPTEEEFPIEDPAQAWNALTIGGFTNKVDIDDPHRETWRAVASVGDRSPFSRTSTAWNPKLSPIKPELVLEAGNRAINPAGNQIETGIESLSLLTTSRDFLTGPTLVEATWGTSPATALASGMAAGVRAEYPDFWPETIRALMIHSADWTPEMQRQLEKASTQEARLQLLRQFGYGVPQLSRALASARNDVVLLTEAYIQPFRYPADGESRGPKYHQIHYYALPWPRNTLAKLYDKHVKLKVTLSYFVEPNPGYLPSITPAPHRYRSYGLRFDLKRSREKPVEFRSRVNKFEEIEGAFKDKDAGWMLGTNDRAAGSLHCDIWEGTAADLATRDQIAIYPASGWWYHNPRMGRVTSRARYSLIVSLSARDLDVDLYTEIMQAIRIEPETEVPV